MSGTLQIGGLHISLSMSQAEFLAAAKTAEGAMNRLAVRFGVAAGAGAAAGQMLANSLTAAARGIAGGFKGAIDSIGDLVDASSKFGIPVEQLAVLKHAAELSGASFEQLGVGAGKLAKNLTEIAGGKTDSPAAKALTALGISAKDSAGQLKGVDEVIIQVSDKFAGLEDGTAKTAIAMQLFGKSGAQLIPTLNLGSTELARLRDEARRLGLVLDAETAKGVEALGDEWQNVGKRMDGFYIQLTGQLLPTLQKLVKDIQDWIDSGGGVQAWARNVGDGIKSVVDWAYTASAAFERLRSNLATAGGSFASFFSGNWSEIAEKNRAGAEELLKIDQKLADDRKAIWAKHAAEVEGPPQYGPQTGDKGQAPIPDAGAAEDARAKAQKLHNAELERYLELRKLQRDIEMEVDPITAKLAETQDKLGRALQKTVIDSETYGIAMSKASAIAMNSYANMAGSIVSDLGTVFGESKGFAIAAALINTFQSITNAWANVPWPLNIAAAAAAGAAGFAQVANIRNTTKGGGGGGGGSSGGASAAPAAAAPVQQQSLFVSGLSADTILSGMDVRSLVEKIAAFQADGGKVVFG
jgi:hypothetical protein